MQLWEGVGSSTTGYGTGKCIRINHTGQVSLHALLTLAGTGSVRAFRLTWPDVTQYLASTTAVDFAVQNAIINTADITVDGTIATDIWVISYFFTNLRSEA